MAQDLLWDYARRCNVVDAEFSADLKTALKAAGFDPLTAYQGPKWRPIAEANGMDGTPYWVYVAVHDGLPAFQTLCIYHPDAGWCSDELRTITHFVELKEITALLDTP